MGRTELFSYLAAFVTIVLAVAITNVIQSINMLIQARRRVRWDGRPLVFAAIVALAILSEFFSLWSHFAVGRLSMLRLIWLLAVPTALALLAYSTLPDEYPPDGVDLGTFYLDQRRVWAVLFGLAAVFDFGRGLEIALASGHSIAMLAATAPFYVPMSVGLGIIFAARTRLWSWVGIALLGLTFLAELPDWWIAVSPGR